MASQIVRCYASNRRVSQPVNVCVASFGGRLQEVFARSYADYEKFDVEFCTQPFEARFSDRTVVYLSADSDCVLDDVHPATVYVIGALIDRNRHKVCCCFCHRIISCCLLFCTGRHTAKGSGFGPADGSPANWRTCKTQDWSRAHL